LAITQNRDANKNLVTLIADFLLVATIVFFWPQALDVFNYPKAVVLIVGAFSLVIAAVITNPYLFQRNSATTLNLMFILIILGILVTSSFHQLFSFGTLWGQFGRANGIVVRVALFCLMLIYFNFGTNRSMNRFFKSITFVLIFEIIYGLFQLLGKDFFEWNNPYGNIFVTTGNPNFAAALLAILSILNLCNAWFGRTLISKLGYLTVSILGTGIAYKTASLQGPLLIFLALFLLMMIAMLRSRIKATFKFLGVSAFIVFGAFITAGVVGKGPLNNLLFQETLNVRLHYWRVAIRIIHDHPLVGVGIDSYGDYFRVYREAAFVQKYGVGLISNNAHNALLQWGAEVGILGLAIYGALILVPTWIYIKHFRNSSDKGLLNKPDFLFVSYVIYYLQTLISITQLSVTAIGFAILGNFLSLYKYSEINQKSKDVNSYQNRSRQPTKEMPLGVGSIFCFFAVLIAILAVKPLKVDIELLKALNLPGTREKVSDLSTRSEAIKKAIQPLIRDEDYVSFAIQNLFNQGDASQGVVIAKEVVRYKPNSWVGNQALVLAFANSNNHSESLKYGLLTEKLDPLNYNIWINIAMQAQKAGEIELAKQYCQKVLQVAPVDSDALRNARVLQSMLKS